LLAALLAAKVKAAELYVDNFKSAAIKAAAIAAVKAVLALNFILI
jgi:hypothetical protein